MMDDEDAERIAKKARDEEHRWSDLTNRVGNLEGGQKSLWMAVIWLGGAFWAGIVYLAVRFAETLGIR